jgi:hypothetical protein
MGFKPNKTLSKLAVFTMFCLISISGLTACGTTTEVAMQNNASEGETAKPIEVDNMEDLESGKFYIQHKGKYYQLYRDHEGADGNTLWYNEDWKEVPTMYEGDQLIYYSDEHFDEKFTFNRYLYQGYTLGICNLTETDSGRFGYTGDHDNTDINMASDAKKLYKVGDTFAIIDKIGGAPLRKGNIDTGGIIKGLKKNKIYNTQVYVGTNMFTFQLEADSIALTLSQSEDITDFTFLENRILQLNIPYKYKTGYYDINGMGLFRYVKGKTYNEKTNFNEPNIAAEETLSDSTDNQPKELAVSDLGENPEYVEVVNIEKAKKITITVNYNVSGNNSPTPTAKLVGNNAVYTLSETAGNTLTGTFTVPKGSYKLVIKDLRGNDYTYKIK